MSDESVASDDRGFLYGDGLFETVRVEGGRALFLARHRRRFVRSAQALGFPSSAVDDGLAALDSLAGRDDGLWRVTVTRPGKGAFGGGTGCVRWRRRPLPSEQPEARGEHLTMVDGFYQPTDPLAGHKTTSWLRSAEARRRAKKAGFDEALLVSSRGRVGEASAANVFLRVGGDWVTPSLQAVLPGVMREVVLEGAVAEGMSIEERPVFVGDVHSCEAMALTSVGRMITAVASVDDLSMDVDPVRELRYVISEYLE